MSQAEQTAMRIGLNDELAGQAAGLTVPDLFLQQVRLRPNDVAITVAASGATCAYAALNGRVNQLAHALRGLGIQRGERVAILAENRPEYVELVMAAAKLGAIVCCQNWRQAEGELTHCIRLTTPRLAIVSPTHAGIFSRIDHGVPRTVLLGEEYEAMLAAQPSTEPPLAALPEDGLLIIYTSGTTGLPKGAMISHRAEIARMQTARIDLGLQPGEAFPAWPPMFHMASTDQAISVLCTGGKVIVMEGADPAQMAKVVAEEQLWWLILMPGMIDQLSAELRERRVQPKGVRLIGAMADLVPLHQIAEITALLQAPYLNTFGATETGLPPATGSQIPIGVVPERLSKQVSSQATFRLVDAEDNDVPDGTPGELAMRGATLFSGYWNNPEANEKDFRGGWFHMGDMFVRNPDGSLDFVDRVKYLIKSGGENIYPAEIERVLLSDERVDDAIIVRKKDEKWGEVPVAFVARNDDSLTAEELIARCRAELAGYKRPKEIHFVAVEDLPRSTTGKIQRHEVEKWLQR